MYIEIWMDHINFSKIFNLGMTIIFLITIAK